MFVLLSSVCCFSPSDHFGLWCRGQRVFPSLLERQTAEQKGRHAGCERFIIHICATLSLKISLALKRDGEEAFLDLGVCVCRPQLQRCVPPDHGSSVEQRGGAEAAWAPASCESVCGQHGDGGSAGRNPAESLWRRMLPPPSPPVQMRMLSSLRGDMMGDN